MERKTIGQSAENRGPNAQLYLTPHSRTNAERTEEPGNDRGLL